MSETESFESVAKSYDNCTWIGKDRVKAAIDRLKAAHDREIRDTSQQEYHRGFNDGEHSIDAEHRAIAMRLRALPLDGGSHENLSQIARAVYHADFGWTRGACASLRDELVRLMGGVSDDTCDSQCRGACAAGDGGNHGEQTEVSDGRVVDDSVCDTSGSYRGVSVHLDGLKDDGTCPNDVRASSITDELRERIAGVCKVSGLSGEKLYGIADRIDAQFDRICEHQEAVLQSAIDSMCEEQDRLQERLRTAELGCDANHQLAEANARWCDELVDLLRDAATDFKNASYGWDYAIIVGENITMETERNRLVKERDELQAKLDEIRDALDG